MKVTDNRRTDRRGSCSGSPVLGSTHCQKCSESSVKKRIRSKPTIFAVIYFQKVLPGNRKPKGCSDGVRFKDSWCYKHYSDHNQTSFELYMAHGCKMTKILGAIAPLAPC